MSTDTYRTPGRAVDETEVEVARIREAEETIRKRDELKHKERSARRDYFWQFVGYDGTMAMIGLSLLVIVGTLATIAIMYAHSRFFR